MRGEEVVERLRADEAGTVWLDAARAADGPMRSLLFADPVRVLTADRIEDVPLLLSALDEAVNAGYFVAGYLHYEAGLAFEDVATRLPSDRRLGWFGIYRAPRVLSGRQAERVVDEAGAGAYDVRDEVLGLDRATYRDRLAQVAAAIREGEVYQVNFTDRVSFAFDGNPLALYRSLRRRQRVPYGAYLHDGDQRTLCLSPELFFRREGPYVLTRPMKGTARRGRTLTEDAAQRTWLSDDAKSQAENLMIVDLLRNDLSRCCRPGSVQVPSLFETEQYETLIQMTSTVAGELDDDVGYADLFRALFPCGSVTGAPKIRAMQLIDELERVPRGVYCGSIGYAAPDDRAVFNVAIRTVVLQDGIGHMGTGSGVVADSNADAEYDECLLKTHFLAGSRERSDAFQLIETMRWEGEIALFDLHLERLAASACYFGFTLDRDVVNERVKAVTAQLAAEPHKIRLTLGDGGHVEVNAVPVEPWAEEPLRLVLAAAAVDAENPDVFHKTTRRTLYEEAYGRARAAGYDEVVLRNGRGEVTEGSRTNVFIRNGDVYVTPPVASGLLGGVFRRHLLDTLPRVEERVLYPVDLVEADAVYVTNAVRGIMKATLASTSVEV